MRLALAKTTERDIARGSLSAISAEHLIEFKLQALADNPSQFLHARPGRKPCVVARAGWMAPLK